VLLTRRDDVFIFGGREREVETLAKEAGLTLSTTSSRTKGHPVYFTPEPHAVLHLWNHADAAAREALGPLREEWERSNMVDAPAGFSIPVPEFCELMPFQAAGVHYAKDRANCLIGDAPGLGKTIQAIALANLRGCKRVLVVCPANVRPQWARQIKIWSTIPKVVVYPVFKSSDGVHPTANYVITSFEVARDGLWDTLRSYNWDLLVIDEGHYLKTPDAARTRAIFGASKQSKCRYAGTGGISERSDQVVALTGTPLPNRPRECFTLANALAPDAIDWMNFATFKDRFNPGGRDMESGATWEYVARLPELNARLRCNFMVRRLKEDVLKDLPPKRYELVPVETTGSIAMALHAEKMLDFDEEEMLARSGGRIDGAISTVRRQMGEAMAPAALEHCKILVEGGVGKLVVFAHHHAVLDHLQKGLAGSGVIRVDGGTSAKGKHAAVEKFKFDPRIRVFLGQGQSVGTGTDGLQEVASHAVFAEASWVGAENEQCVDRLHRMGQDGSVLAQFLVAPGSISERIIGRSIAKTRITTRVLDALPV
jgi:SWI/SNF-related matrix-associated actin-dependent regulator 1 of chromatin subfamily A